MSVTAINQNNGCREVIFSDNQKKPLKEVLKQIQDCAENLLRSLASRLEFDPQEWASKLSHLERINDLLTQEKKTTSMWQKFFSSPTENPTENISTLFDEMKKIKQIAEEIPDQKSLTLIKHGMDLEKQENELASIKKEFSDNEEKRRECLARKPHLFATSAISAGSLSLAAILDSFDQALKQEEKKLDFELQQKQKKSQLNQVDQLLAAFENKR